MLLDGMTIAHVFPCLGNPAAMQRLARTGGHAVGLLPPDGRVGLSPHPHHTRGKEVSAAPRLRGASEIFGPGVVHAPDEQGVTPGE